MKVFIQNIIIKNKKIYKWVNIKPDKFGSEADVYKTIKYAKKIS